MEQKYQTIDDRAVTAANHFLRNEALLVDIIQEVNEERVFERLGFSSLFVYCTERLKLSPSYAWAFISVARKAKDVPELKQAVASGNISVSQAKRIVSVIEPANATDWIHKAATEKQRDLERAVASSLPAPKPCGRIRRVGGDMSKVTLLIPESMRGKVMRLMEVRSCSLPEALEFALDEALKRHDPLQKAARNANKTYAPKKENAPHSSRKRPSRTPIPAHITHAVTLRDEGRCVVVLPTGLRCESQRYLHLHHLVPVSQGGENTVSNLVTLCGSCHRALHKGFINLNRTESVRCNNAPRPVGEGKAASEPPSHR